MNNNYLSADTPRFSKFTRKELRKALNAEKIAPLMQTVDGTSVVIEGNAILFFDMSENSKDFSLHYYYLYQKSDIQSSPRRLQTKNILPKKALIVKQRRDALYVYMGVANLEVLNVKVDGTSGNRIDTRRSREFLVISASGTFIDVPTTVEEEQLKKYGAVDPKTYEVLTKTHYRSPYVAEYARRKANGICQLCGNPAPFNDPYDKPYLEIHHVKWLSRGGSDTVENVVALCPNCHSRMHVLDREEDIRKLEEVIIDRER